jgi:hypothetical protein
VIDFDAPLGEQFLDVAVGQAERRYQRTATTITSDGKRKRRKQTAGLEQSEGDGFSCRAVSLLERGHGECMRV